MEVQDNFLKYEEYRNLQKLISRLEWKISRCVSENDQKCNENENFQMTHEFYKNYVPQSNYFNSLYDIITKISPSSICRIKANLNPKTSTIIEHGFHIDNPYNNCKTSIYYVNSNDGYTLFENGKKINSIANRLLTFDSSIKHCGTTCTDVEARIVINFNYF